MDFNRGYRVFDSSHIHFELMKNEYCDSIIVIPFENVSLLTKTRQYAGWCWLLIGKKPPVKVMFHRYRTTKKSCVMLREANIISCVAKFYTKRQRKKKNPISWNNLSFIPSFFFLLRIPLIWKVHWNRQIVKFIKHSKLTILII